MWEVSNISEPSQNRVALRRDNPRFLFFNRPFESVISISFLDEIYSGSSDLVRRFLQYLLKAIFIVGFYRFLILKDAEHLRTIAIKRAIVNAKTLLTILFYFRFGVREILVPFIGFTYICLQLLYANLLAPIFFSYYSDAHSNQFFTEHPLLGTYLNTSIRLILFPLLSALFILLAPYVATAEKLNLASALRVIKAIRGNVVRVAVISFLIYLPIYLPDVLSTSGSLIPEEKLFFSILTRWSSEYVLLKNLLYYG